MYFHPSTSSLQTKHIFVGVSEQDQEVLITPAQQQTVEIKKRAQHSKDPLQANKSNSAYGKIMLKLWRTDEVISLFFNFMCRQLQLI